MACLGSRALQSKRPKGAGVVVEAGQMGGDASSSKHSGGRREKNGKNKKERRVKHKDSHEYKPPKKSSDFSFRDQKSSKLEAPVPQAMFLRKSVDPETAKYFSEISNLFESGGVDLGERSNICGNALEEARGKELELSTDKILSRTMETLLEGCDIYQLCGFLQNCAKDFPTIATDKSGSHVAETALKSLSVQLQDKEAYSMIENALTKICQVVVKCPAVIMCSSYGSHVLRSLLCLCKGTPLEALEQYHRTNKSFILAERLNFGLPQPDASPLDSTQEGFPHLLKFLIREMLKQANDISTLLLNQYGSLVLQVSLRLLAGDIEELSHTIPILLVCQIKNLEDKNCIGNADAHKILDLLKDTSYSHLMEVILEVSPAVFYDEILTKIFSGSLYDISLHHCGSFVVQALISSVRCQSQIEVICEELGSKVKELLEFGKSGVVASMLAACQRIHIYENKICQALIGAMCSSPAESSSCIVPRILFLENYFRCEEKPSWRWPEGDKMHTLGCLMLQTVFKCPIQYIQPYIESITSMESHHVFETAKDAGGGRVIEAFLCSDASSKQKHKIIVKLKGHFGELSLHPSGSFAVEKCFAASNLSEKEIILSELVAAQDELSKRKHGLYLLKKLDVDVFLKQPAQWKSRQTSKQAAYKEFKDMFGSAAKAEKVSFLTSTPSQSAKKGLKQMRREIDQSIEISLSRLGLSSSKRQRRGNSTDMNYITQHSEKEVARSKEKVPFITKKFKGRSNHFMSRNAVPSNKGEDTAPSRTKKRLTDEFHAVSLKKHKK